MNQLRNKQITERQDKERQFILDKEQAKIDAQNKIDQQDANISNQIRSGVENVNLPQVGNRTQQLFGIPNIPKQVGVPLNQQPDGEIAGKRRLFGDLSTQGQTRFNREQSFANSLLPKEQLAPPVEEFINADELPNLKKWEGYVVKKTTKSVGGGEVEISYGQPFKRVVEKRDGEDKKYTDLHGDIFKEYDKRKKAYLDALAIKGSMEQGGNPVYVDPALGYRPYTESIVTKMTNSAKLELGEYVDNNFSETASTYIAREWDNIASENVEDVPEDIWNKTYDDLLNKRIEPSTWKELYYKYISEFGFDPLVKYAR